MDAETVDEQALVACCEITALGEDVDDKFVPSLVNYSNTYQDLVAAYTKRQMSFQSDGLNAMRGMLNMLQREYDVLLLCGLPVPHLIGFFLTWCSHELSTRRVDERTGEAMFPSWSFVGWQGEASYLPSSYPNTLFEQKFGADGIVVDLEEEISDWTVLLPPDPEQSSVQEQSPDAIGSALMNVDTCVLCFTARTARFKVVRETYGTPAEIQYDGSESLCRQIVLDETQVGSVVPHYFSVGYSSPLDDNPQDDYAFVALSKSIPRWAMWYPEMADDSRNEQNSWYKTDEHGLVEHPPFGESEYDVLGSVMNVLLIWRSGGLARRAGIGQIHVDAWEKAGPKETKIRLG